ncbi:MAG: BamA/TamA family outer membrane protein [Gemmatimonadaceae bacterium]|nr:BamA/TamA family outer membrane protein [Gemmatimonadaceae bacterium]
MRPRSLLLVLLLAALAAPSPAPAAPAEADRTDTTDVYETRRNHLLALPKYAWNALVHPIGRFTIWVEHEQVPARVLDLFTNEAETFGVFPYGALGGETGTAGGLTTFHTDLFGRGKGFSANLIGNRDNYKGAALYDDPGIGGGPWYWNASVEALRTGHENATINGELRGSGSLLQLEQRDARITLGRRSNYGETDGYEPEAVIELRLSHGFREFVADGPLSGGIPGLNEAINQLSVGASAAFDDRDFKAPTTTISHSLNYQFPGRVLLFADDHYYSLRDTAFPERGGLAGIEADYVVGSGDVRYIRYAAEFHRFFTLFYRDRILGIRVRLENAHPLGEDSLVPYSDMPALGGGQRLRGYRRGYFRNQGSLLLGAEYRYPIWDTWNAFLFWDEGQVFGRYGDLEAGRFEYSFGAGISVRTERAFLFGLRIARSEEEKALTGFSLEKEF